MQAEGYGGYSDWKVLFHTVSVPDAGRIEHNARSNLYYCRMNRPYYKDGSRQIAEELLNCSFSAVLQALADELGDIDAWSGIYWWHRHNEFPPVWKNVANH
jgi:hypothetical protein